MFFLTLMMAFVQRVVYSIEFFCDCTNAWMQELFAYFSDKCVLQIFRKVTLIFIVSVLSLLL